MIMSPTRVTVSDFEEKIRYDYTRIIRIISANSESFDISNDGPLEYCVHGNIMRPIRGQKSIILIIEYHFNESSLDFNAIQSP